MFEIFNTLSESNTHLLTDHPHAEHAKLLNTAIHRFNRNLGLSRWTRFWTLITGGRQRLINLADYSLKVCASSYAGLQSVPIRKIYGSEGKSCEFDCHFRPLCERTRDRWVSIVMARGQGISLPAVELIQIGDAYFVRDGHHRISVAVDSGQEQIDATVTVWQVAGELPWHDAEIHPLSRFIQFASSIH